MQNTDATPSLLTRIATAAFTDRTALVGSGGRLTHGELLAAATAWGQELAAARAGDRIAYLVPPGRAHVAVLLGIWARRGIAVPLAVSHPPRELDHVLDDARPCMVVIDPTLPHAPHLTASTRARGATALTLPTNNPAPIPTPPATPRDDAASPHPTPPHSSDPALIIYTSGTTGRPRGVLITHRNLTARITALTTAWDWAATDRILHTLPLHHVHGLVNALACALWSGAACEFGGGAPASAWDRLASGEVTLFMSVPTVYARLIRAWEAAPAPARRRWSRGTSRLRLMVSGSAALPVATLERWREITGHTLLERYGTTEIGMALSNPLAGERRPGHVGLPLPGVEARIVDDRGRPLPPGRQGEIEVRGPQVFREYRGRPADTGAAFRDGWFRTGDEGCAGEGGYFRILGRRSADIVKTGGVKVSALEVEDVYRAHPAVGDLAVVGVPHAEWGEQLSMAWVSGDGRATPSRAELRAWGRERLAPYKVPREFRAVSRLPRNAMGKVQKGEVRRIFTG